MARTLIYERGVQCVVTDDTLYEKLNSLENGVKIKEEPPDQDEDHTYNETLSAENETLINAYNQTTEAKQTSSSPLNNKENECMEKSFTRRKKRRKASDGYTRPRHNRWKRKKNASKALLTKEPKHTEDIEEQSEDLVKNSSKSLQAKKEQESLHSQESDPEEKNEEIDLKCNVCMLPMKQEILLRRHQTMYSMPMYMCEICKVVYTYKRSWTYHATTCSGIAPCYFPKCNFCGACCKTKAHMQSHIFHCHWDHIYPPALGKSSPEKLKSPNNFTRTKIILMPPNAKLMSPKTALNTPKCKSNTPNGQLNKSLSEPESLKNSKNDIADETHKEESITPVKKMRQTMLTEFLIVSNKKEQKLTPQRNETTERNGMESTGTNRLSPDKCRKPFVQIHTDTALMMELLNKSDIKNEPLDDEVRSITSRQSTPYSLRPTIPPVYTPDTIMLLNSSKKRKRTHSGTDLSPQTNHKKPVRKLKNTEINDNILKAKFNIEECYVRLVRYETISDMLELLPEEKKIFETPTRSSAVRMCSLQDSLVLEPPRERELDHHSEENSPHKQRKPFQCKICKKMFSSKRNLSEHNELFHVAYISSICNARYTSKYKLLHHYLRQHTIFKRTDCCVCRLSFESRSHLQRHLLVHCIQVLRTKRDRFPVDVIMKCNAFQKNHMCSICGKRFWLSSCVKNHESACAARRQGRAKEDTPKKSPPSRVNEDTPTKSPPSGAKEDTPKKSPPCPPEDIHDTDKSSASQVSSPTHSTTPQSKAPEDKKVDTPSTSKSSSLRAGRKSQNDRGKETSNSTPEHRLRKKTRISYEIRDDSTESEADDLISTSSTQKDVTNETYECSVCNIKFGSLIKLNAHTRLVGGELKHRCTFCSIALPNRRLLGQHMDMTHMSNTQEKHKNTCKYCNQVFINVENQLIHEKHFHASQIAVVPEQTWLNEEQVWNINTSCNTCNVVFENYDKLVEHNMYYYEGQSFTCTFCGQSFLGLFMLHHHSKLLHYPKTTRASYTFNCNICNEGFNQESHFHAHQFHVHANDPSKSSLTNNTLDSQGQQPASSSSLQTLKVPIIEARQWAFVVHICNICQMSFTTEAELIKHEMQYSLNGDYLCNGCDKRCRTFMLLKQHYSLNHIDTDVANGYKCKQCSEIFISTTSLICHEKHVHPEESVQRYALIAALEKNVDQAMSLRKSEPPNLKCLICQTAFETELDLREHLFEYANIGEHKCAVCHRAFVEAKRLEEHKIKHSRISTIVAEHYCPICQEGQTSATNVSIHMLHLHGSETFDSILTKRGCLTSKLIPNSQLDNTEKNSTSHPTPLPPSKSEGNSNVVLNAPLEQQPDTSNTSSNIPVSTEEKAPSAQEETPVIPNIPTIDSPNARPVVVHAIAPIPNSDNATHHNSKNDTSSSTAESKSNTGDTSSQRLKKVVVVNPRTLTVDTLLKDMEGPTDGEPSGNEDYKCAECGIKFNNRRNLAKHLLKYINDGNFLCDQCPRRFILESICEEHCRRHQVVDETTHRYTCQFCTERFKTLRAGRSHLIHLHKKKNLKNTQGDTSPKKRTSKSKEPQTKVGTSHQAASSEPETSTRVPEVEPASSVVTNPSEETEIVPPPILVTKTAPIISTKSLASCLDFSCEACSLPFDNFLAYHAHCRLVHPNLILFADYISNGPTRLPTSEPVNVVLPNSLPLSDSPNEIIVDASKPTEGPANPPENPSEDLEIIWEKKADPKDATTNDTGKGDSDSSIPTEVTAERSAPRLKVRPFAKIIETLTLESSDSEHSSDVYPQLPKGAQVTDTNASLIPQLQ